MSKPPPPLSDADLDALLARATAPQIPAGGPARLMARLAEQPGQKQSEVITFPVQPVRAAVTRVPLAARRRFWPIPALLAASLAAGLVLGISLDDTDPFFGMGNINAADDVASLSGVDNLLDGSDGDAS